MRRSSSRGAKARARARAKSSGSARPAAKAPAGGKIDANSATFEQLRGLGMSVTQATRVIAYRERKDGFDSIDDMDTIPGFPKDLIEEMKGKLTA
jgi:DNA uptake protein ComE-like DNA-binding protein